MGVIILSCRVFHLSRPPSPLTSHSVILIVSQRLFNIPATSRGSSSALVDSFSCQQRHFDKNEEILNPS